MTMESCHFLQLPDELKLEIVKHVDQRRDLYNFSLACRSLEDMVLSRLYKSVDLDVPNSENPSWSKDALPAFRPYVLQNMRELAIRNGYSDPKNPVYHRRRRSDANTMDKYVGEIYKGIPQDRLKSFSFQHQSPMTFQMLDGLSKQHGNGLRHLQCCELELELLDTSEVSLPTNLHSLECRSVLFGESVAKLTEVNKDTLRSLSLGQDKHLHKQYRQRRIGFLNNIPQPFNTSADALELSAIPNLKSLSLSGIDLAPLIEQGSKATHCLTQLESLTLESCPNTAEFLTTLASTFTQTKTSGLKLSLTKFSLRHEVFTTPFQDSLVSFLNSFSGLTSLTILIENTIVTARPSAFLNTHGATLNYLTLESRIQPRSHLHIDPSRPFGTGASQTQLWLNTLNDIAKTCPNLTELGTAIPWDDLSIHNLNNLTNLKLLHVRNFPTSQSKTELGDTVLKEHADELLAWCDLPSLEHLAIGPTVFTTRWRLNAPTSPTSPSTLAPPTTTEQPSSSSSSSTTTTTYRPRTLPLLAPTHTQSRTNTAQRRLQAAVVAATLIKREKGYNVPPEHLRTHYFSIAEDGGVGDKLAERDMEESRGRTAGVGLGGVFEGLWLR